MAAGLQVALRKNLLVDVWFLRCFTKQQEYDMSKWERVSFSKLGQAGCENSEPKATNHNFGLVRAIRQGLIFPNCA